MRKIFALLILVLFLVPICSCSRTVQTESLIAPTNQNALLKALKDGAAKLQLKQSDRVSVVYVLREGNTFSINSYSALGKLLKEKITGLYPFKSEQLSDHQKTMIDTFIRNTVLSDSSFVLRGDGANVNMVVVAHMRAYSLKTELYIDIFDFSNGDQISRVQYEMSDASYEFQLKK
jgi:hypothetical protein